MTATITTENRTVNLGNLIKYTEAVSKHSRFYTSGVVNLVKETKHDGLASVLSAKCSCSHKITFPTSNKLSGLSRRDYWECNLTAVWGQMSLRGGHSNLQKTMSALGVPVMTKRSFIASEKKLVNGGWKSCRNQ
uniref:Mutator-like transposase domain-containing protein n=1 Tax=Amphimedon queenslandica TaxID=400682 RepID=A0A1X7VYG9_AMPQE